MQDRSVCICIWTYMYKQRDTILPHVAGGWRFEVSPVAFVRRHLCSAHSTAGSAGSGSGHVLGGFWRSKATGAGGGAARAAASSMRDPWDAPSVHIGETPKGPIKSRSVVFICFHMFSWDLIGFPSLLGAILYFFGRFGPILSLIHDGPCHRVWAWLGNTPQLGKQRLLTHRQSSDVVSIGSCRSSSWIRAVWAARLSSASVL